MRIWFCPYPLNHTYCVSDIESLEFNTYMIEDIARHIKNNRKCL